MTSEDARHKRYLCDISIYPIGLFVTIYSCTKTEIKESKWQHSNKFVSHSLCQDYFGWCSFFDRLGSVCFVAMLGLFASHNLVALLNTYFDGFALLVCLLSRLPCWVDVHLLCWFVGRLGCLVCWVCLACWKCSNCVFASCDLLRWFVSVVCLVCLDASVSCVWLDCFDWLVSLIGCLLGWFDVFRFVRFVGLFVLGDLCCLLGLLYGFG